MATRQGLDASIVTRLGADEQAIFFAVKAEFDTDDIRVWSGTDDLTVNSETYTGAGALLTISNIEENLEKLSGHYNGLCVIKSTVEPGVTELLSEKYNLNIAHNPEFLTERTSFEDFHNQKHIVIGTNEDAKRDEDVIILYKELYPDAKISICKSEESEAMKLFCNNFYAMKVQIFNEFYFICQKIGADFHEIKDLMLKNNWINSEHTQVPGRDGKISYGGHCFPKDTKALCHFMKTSGSPYGVLEACIKERDSMRDKKLE